MLNRLFFISFMVYCLQVAAVEVTPRFASTPEYLHLARTIVGDLVAGKLPDEILTMVDEIAVALSQKGLCGTEDIQAMMEAGIPFDAAYPAVIKACNLQGADLVAFNRAIPPGLPPAAGGAGTEVSP